MTSVQPEATTLTIAVLGAGTVGRTLAAGWVRSGHRVLLGSRKPDSPRLIEAAADVLAAAATAESSAPPTGTVSAGRHADVARVADVVVVCVPGDQVASLIADLGETLGGKVVVDTTNKVGGDGSLNSAADLTDAGASVSRAFNTVGWEQMAHPEFGDLRADMPFAGPASARPTVERLIRDIGFRPAYLGDDQLAMDAVDSLAKLWFLMAFRQGYGRRLGLRFLTAEDDSPAVSSSVGGRDTTY